ncbi:MAG: DciA family protein [Pseudomonadota bacterium]
MNNKPKTPKQWMRTRVQPQTQTLQHYAQFAAQLKQWQLLFQRVAGRPLADHCQLLNVRDKKLIVKADAATWATQLKLKQNAIITHFQQDAMIAINQLEVTIKPPSDKDAYAPTQQLSRRERILKLAEGSEEPLRSELLKLAEKMW